MLLLVSCIAFAAPFNRPAWVVSSPNETLDADVEAIRWVHFDIPATALEQAMNYDVNSQNSGYPLNWIRLLAVLGAKYGGDFTRYQSKDLEQLVYRLQNGESLSDITANLSNYDYYVRAYGAVLDGFLGEYAVRIPAEDGSLRWETRYGLKVYSPIAGGFYYDHYDDFCADRSYGYDRKHLGHDLMCSIGTPITAVESGVVEEMGWNQYGGWRIGIRSFDGQRYYYYAHMRQNRPYHPNMAIGAVVRAGDVIGYVGRTGYSPIENTNNITSNHLHWGMQLVFDEGQKDGPNQIWIDLYELTIFLERHKSPVYRVAETKEYYRKYDFSEATVLSYLQGRLPLPYPEKDQT